MRLTRALAAEYTRLFNECRIPPRHLPALRRAADAIAARRARYESVTEAVPWQVTGILHHLETGLRFDRHLHNGDPLTARTVRVPAGRPPQGNPPFAWEESARDALQFRGLCHLPEWTLPVLLHALEGYNGWGYRRYHPETPSPYLWSFTNHYHRGKYTADGRWSPAAVSKQPGAAALLLALAEVSPSPFAMPVTPRL